MKHTFSKKSFERTQFLTEEMRKLLGTNCHAETSYATVVIDYSPTFMAMLRPFPPKEVYDYELRQFRCRTCKTLILMIAEESFTYDDCHDCKNKKAAKAAEESRKAKEKNSGV